MKIVSYTIVHYGIDYLPWALHSIAGIVDKSYVFYTSKPSHNHTTDTPCPETFNDVKNSIQLLLDNSYYNIELIEQSQFRYEGQQRDWAKQYVIDHDKPDLLLVVDADEIWPHQTLTNAIEEIVIQPKKRVHTWRVNMTHLWRSFDWCCKDQGWPDRIFDLSVPPNDYGYISHKAGSVYHFGYCIKDKILKYKIKIHGHKSEFRKNWFQNKWNQWKPEIRDVHPTNAENFWDPIPFNKYTLPTYMRDHPFWDLKIVK